MDYNTENGWWGTDLPTYQNNSPEVRICYEEGGWFFPTPEIKTRIVVRTLEEELTAVKVA